MYAIDVSSHYRRQSVATASPGRLVVMLYEGAITAIERARRELAAPGPDFGTVSRELGRAQQIVVELELALDREHGGVVAESLAALYGFLRRRLVEANMAKQAGPLEDVVRILRPLHESWQMLVEEAEEV